MKVFRLLLEPYVVLLCAFGLVFGAIPLKRTHAAEPVPICRDLASLPTGDQPFAQLQCSIHSTIFNDNLAPSILYRFNKLIADRGDFTGLDAYGRAVSFTAVSVTSLPLAKLLPDQFVEGDDGSICFGYLIGPAGKARVSAISIKKQSITLTPGASAVVILESLSVAELDAIEQTERIKAGVRVYNTATGKSCSLADAAPNCSMTSTSSDLANLAQTPLPPGATTGVPIGCVELQFKLFRIADDSAQGNMRDCVKWAVVAFVACMALLLVGLLATTWVFPLTLITARVGVATCLSAQAIIVAACLDQFRRANKAARDTLKASLEGCGVFYYEV